jgi:hypothetical protein
MAMASKIVYIFFTGNQRSIKASQRIRQGETIVELPKIPLSEPDMYSIEIYPGIHVDCESSLAGAINHSCNPNAFVKENRIVAWKCINPGDEVTIDYRITETKMASPFYCKCGYCKGELIHGKL